MRGVKAKRLRRLQQGFIAAGMNPPRKLRRLARWIDQHRGEMRR